METNYKYITVEGTKYRTLLTKKFENRKKWENPDERKIHSLIPGVILKVNVKDGDKVKAGEDIIIFEAMKMKNRISIPFDAVIKKIYIEEGQRISKDQLILEIE